MDSFVQLFLEDCRKRADQEDIAQRVINFNALNIDVIMFRFHADLPWSFHKKEENAKENNNPSNTSSTNSNNGKGKHVHREEGIKQQKDQEQQPNCKIQDGQRRDLGEDLPRKMPW